MKKKKSKQKRQWFSNHKKEILPPLVGIFIMFIVFGVINSQLISGKIASASSTVSDEEASQVVSELSVQPADENPTLRIAKIGAEVPVSFDAKTVDENVFQELLKYGTVHYPTTAKPGEPGNTVIFGHSSGRWWAQGDFKYIFSRLDKLEPGDKIFIDYTNTRFMYEVVGQRIILPTNVSILSQETDHELTLFTCYPVGSNAKRLVVTAKQISPAPAEYSEQNEPTNSTKQEVLPATVPSFWDNFRDIF